jgi:murein DD-endopeptidase MepM/ murein hydrolase activator NlpD
MQMRGTSREKSTFRALLLALCVGALPLSKVLYTLDTQQHTLIELAHMSLSEPVTLHPDLALAPSLTRSGQVIEHRVSAGDTLESLAQQYHLTLPGDFMLDQPLASDSLLPGKRVTVVHQEGRLLGLTYTIGTYERFLDQSLEGRSVLHLDDLRNRARLRVFEGIVHQTLASDSVRIGVPAPLVDGMQDAIGNQMALDKEVKSGDLFRIVVGQAMGTDGQVGREVLQAGSIQTPSRLVEGFRFQSPGGEAQYYTANGASVWKTPFAMPVEDGRVSSHFNPYRMNPVLKRRAAHTGTDFSAPVGTPILAAADGEVISVGWKGAYGKVVKIEHEGGYTTLYAHMHTQSVQKGQTVRQGDRIGTVGKTGRVSGAHLHYELHKKGVALDPMTLTRAPSPGLEGFALTRFNRRVQLSQPFVEGVPAEAELVDAGHPGML